MTDRPLVNKSKSALICAEICLTLDSQKTVPDLFCMCEYSLSQLQKETSSLASQTLFPWLGSFVTPTKRSTAVPK